MTDAIVDECGSASLSLLVLGIILVLLAPFAVAASDTPLGLTELDAAAGASARVAAAENTTEEAAIEGERAAKALLGRSRCLDGTVAVAVDVSNFEAVRAPSGALTPGTVTVHVECTIATGRLLHIPWMEDSDLSVEAVEAVDPFRADDRA